MNEQHKVGGFHSFLLHLLFLYIMHLLPVVLVLLVFAGEPPCVEGVVRVPGPEDAGLGGGAGVGVPGLPRHADQVQGGQI